MLSNRTRQALLAGASLLLGTAVACSPGNPEIVETGDTTEWIYDCQGNDDGIIQADELPWATGLAVPYRANAEGSTVSVQPGGEEIEGVTTWDFTQAPGGLSVELDLVDPEGSWFEAHFPGASYAAPLFAHELDILAVFEVHADRFEMLGLASREEQPAEGQTLLVYDEPVEVYRFPLTFGDSWTVNASFRDAKLYGITNAGDEAYHFEVDARGDLLLPGFTMHDTLRLRVDVSQDFAVHSGENPLLSVRHLYLRECFGELARITSLSGETEPEFTEASELRVLDVES
jgi:hypothetical protein